MHKNRVAVSSQKGRKKFFCFFLSALFCLSSCSSGSSPYQGEKMGQWMGSSDKVHVITTTPMLADLVEEIGKDRVFCIPLIANGLDPHSYILVKGDDEKLARADTIFFNGLGLEHGAGLCDYLEKQEKAVAVGNVIFKKFPEKILFTQGVADPHIWMDVSVWSLAVDPIVEALTAVDPQGENEYRENGKALVEKMGQLHKQIRKKMENIADEKRFLVTSHDAFRYFARAYLYGEKQGDWETRFAAPEGLAPEGQLSSSDIQKIIHYLDQHEIEVIFTESNVNKDSILKIATAAKAKGKKIEVAKEPLYGDAMIYSDKSRGYFPTMLHNATTIFHYLSGGE